MKPVLLQRALEFPDPRSVSAEGGLVAFGGDLSVERLLLAYRSGIFPWSAQPITWWSPDPRAVFEFDSFHVSKSLTKIVKRCLLVESAADFQSAVEKGETRASLNALHSSTAPSFHITINQAFRQVMEGCASTREQGNWISSPFIDAYTRLHEAGHAHSVECWREGRLVGGIYGVAIGGLFAGESMFHYESNASKVALYFLFEQIRRRGFTLFDVQMLTPTTEKFGAVEISREEYFQRLNAALKLSVTFCERPALPPPGE